MVNYFFNPNFVTSSKFNPNQDKINSLLVLKIWNA